MEMLLLLNENMCSQSFPNVHIALRIYLAIATSNCSGERSFCKMKRIKNELRGCMHHQRLTFLSLMSIENYIVESLSFNDIISDFARNLCDLAVNDQFLRPRLLTYASLHE